MHQYDRFGYLDLEAPVYKMDSKRKRKFWKCYCHKCNSWCVVREDAIKAGQISCGCVSRGYRAKWLYLRGRK